MSGLFYLLILFLIVTFILYMLFIHFFMKEDIYEYNCYTVIDSNNVYIKYTAWKKCYMCLTCNQEAEVGDGYLSFDNWWIAIGLLFGGAILVGVVKIIVSRGGNGLGSASDIFLIILAGSLYGLFVPDIAALISYVGSLTNYTGWLFYSIAVPLLIFIVMYSFSLMEFIRGTD